MDQAKVPLEPGKILENEIEPQIGADAAERLPGQERTDVVQHQPLDRACLHGRHGHADHAAHRRADPVDLGGAEMLDELQHVAGIGG
jgi:hypothetical protein